MDIIQSISATLASFLINLFKFLGSIKDGVNTIAVIVTSVFACLGFNAWRRAMIGKRKIELAEEAVDLFSRFPSNISAIRLFASCIENEGALVASDPNNPKAWEITLERIQKQKDYFDQLDALRYYFSAYFGEEHERLFDNAFSILSDIRRAALTLAGGDYSDYKSIQRIIHGNPKGDDMSKRADDLRDEMIKLCKPSLL